jgi:hypothetical protein
VVTVLGSHAEPIILRSYNPVLTPREARIDLSEECKIWQACRATSAATTFFDPIEIGKYKQGFTDGATLCNNPVRKVLSETKNIWPGRETLILSIGTGEAPGQRLEGNVAHIIKGLVKITTETEQTANDFYNEYRELVDASRYFRFNARGISHIGLEEYKEVRAIAGATQVYMAKGETGKSLAAYVHELSKSISEG